MSTIAEDLEDAPRRRQRWRIEPTVRVGELMVLVTIVCAGAAAWFGLKAESAQNARDIVTMQGAQRERDAQQDVTVGRIESYLKDGVREIRNEQAEIRREIGEIGRYVRGNARGG